MDAVIASEVVGARIAAKCSNACELEATAFRDYLVARPTSRDARLSRRAGASTWRQADSHAFPGERAAGGSDDEPSDRWAGVFLFAFSGLGGRRSRG